MFISTSIEERDHTVFDMREEAEAFADTLDNNKNEQMYQCPLQAWGCNRRCVCFEFAHVTRSPRYPGKFIAVGPRCRNAMFTGESV